MGSMDDWVLGDKNQGLSADSTTERLNTVLRNLQEKLQKAAEQQLWLESELEHQQNEKARLAHQVKVAQDAFDALQNRFEAMNLTCYRLKKEYQSLLNLAPMRAWCRIQEMKGKPYIPFEQRKFPIPANREMAVDASAASQQDARPVAQTMQSLPSVTVVIPTYKPNEYVAQSVASVLESDYEPDKLRVILAVNGADSAYAEALKTQYAGEPQIQVLHTLKKGASAGRNLARSYLQTEYVTYLDDDDTITSGYLLEMAQHTAPDVMIVCGRMMDQLPDGTIENNTYINRMLRQKKQGTYSSYLEIGSVFSTVCGKLYRRELITDVYEPMNEDVPDTEDTLFWVENIDKTHGGFYLCALDGKEGYVRRVLPNSRSRPEAKAAYAFYVSGRLSLIERFAEVIVHADTSIEHKRFILTKIDAQEKLMADYVNTLPTEQKEKAYREILASSCPFLRRAWYTNIEGIAFCHNFVPFIDASSFVAVKRLPQICAALGRQIAWTVVCADMSAQRKRDPYIDIFYSRYQYKARVITEGKTWFNEEAQEAWGRQAYERVKEMEVPYIYSRSMWAGSHVAAALYKKAHPSTMWIAEFSDPIYMDTANTVRMPGREYSGEKAYLNHFWKDIETTVFEQADQIIFTNENQKQYMLANNPPQNPEWVRQKSQVWPHPVLPKIYRDLIPPTCLPDKAFINIGYFGTFYANRSSSDLLLLLKNEEVCLHLFTNSTPELEELSKEYDGRLRVYPMVSHLEVLSTAACMDYLYLNDIDFPGAPIPYQPSKLADYLSAGTPILALVKPNTPMSQRSEENLIKVTQIDDDLLHCLTRRREGARYRSGISRLSYYKEQYVEAIDVSGLLSIVRHLAEGTADTGYNSLPMPDLFDADGAVRWRFADAEVSRSRNTFFLYHYGLRSIYFLSRIYRLTGDHDKLELAQKILASFYSFFCLASDSTEMLFNDHAMSERIENIIYFWDTAEEAGLKFDRSAALALVEDALDKLSGTGYYQRNHNHGIIADKACLVGYYFLNNAKGEAMLQRTILRLKAQVDYAFGRDGIHKENSIDYHYTVVGMLCGCLNLCKHIRHPYYEELYQKVSDSFAYLVYALKPNLQRPLFGDSKGLGHDRNVDSPAEQLLFAERFGLQKLKYVLTRGREGQKPETTAKWFPSGYVFLREHFEAEDFSQATWLSLRAGYTTRVHKHQDDLSLCLYSRGADIFVDGGMCGYMPKDIYKDYMESLPAHTTVCIKDAPYSIANGNGELFRVWPIDRTEYYFHTMASSYIYEDTVIYRHLFYLCGWNIVVIWDDIHSENEHTYVQYFHLGPRTHPQAEMKAPYGVLYTDGSDLKVQMHQLCPIDELRVLRGKDTSPMSMLSTGFSSCIPTQTLEYSASGRDVSFVTVVEIGSAAERTNCTLESECLTLIRAGETVRLPLERRVPVSLDGVSASCDADGVLTLQNTAADHASHTVYIIGQGGNIQKEAYHTEKEFQIQCAQKLPAQIVYYAQNHAGEIRKGLLGTLHKAEDGMIFLTRYAKPLRPVVRACHVTKEMGDRYTFTLDLDYPLAVNASWWVYKNGACHDFVQNRSLGFEKTLTQPGEYVVMCSLRDIAFGEFFFYQFDKISIVAREGKEEVL